MSVRAHKWVTGVLLCAVVILGWQALSLYRQILAASFISFQCEAIERFASDATDPKALAGDVEALTAYYGGESRILHGSPIARVVQRDYQHALSNALVAFRRITTNDLGDDLGAWVQKYGNRAPPAQKD